MSACAPRRERKISSGDLEKLGGLRFGWYVYGWASHVFESTVLTVFMSRYLPTIAVNSVGREGRLRVLGLSLAPGSLFAYMVTLCSVSLVVLMPIVGAFADRTGRYRVMLFSFAYLGAASCVAMVFVGNTDWVLGALLFAAAFLNYSCAKVIYNSLLIRLAEPNLRDRVSSIGWAAGYLSSGILLALNFGASFVITDSALLARLSLCSAGLWWAVFSLLALRILRRLPFTMPPSSGQKAVVLAGFAELVNTLREMGRFPQTLLFLAAYLIYYDGISTVTTLSADYGQKELGLGDSTLLGAILLVQFTGFGGALLLGRFADRWGAKRVISASLLVWIAVMIAVYFIQAHNPMQFYAVALVLSIVLGGTQALSRSLYSGMIPRGKDAEYYSLYEISSSGTSALGPLLFGLTLQNTGSYRAAIISLLVFFIVGLTLLQAVNPAHAITAVGNQPPTSLT